MTGESHRVALCPHFSVEHFRGGEKWVVTLANYLVQHTDAEVAIHAYPYAPNGTRRVSVEDVLDERIEYTERWRHDLSGVDTAYVFYHPGARLSFPRANQYIAGIHSWAYISQRLYEPHYGLVPTAVKTLYKFVGSRDLRWYDLVHTVTPAFGVDHPGLVTIPNFVDTDIFHPTTGTPDSEFTVLVTAAHIPEKGWDFVERVAEQLPNEIRVCATGEVSHPDITGLGFLSETELAAAYARSHVVFHPSRVDTDSMVINESCASATPIVTSPIPTHIRENAGVLHAGTVQEMRYCLEKLYREWSDAPELYESRCKAAHQSVRGHESQTVFPQLQAMLTGEQPPMTGNRQATTTDSTFVSPISNDY
ncbi:glycosyltransferase family 4 protein [Haloferax sp. Atlit-6N]|uniref:glycosyltransferase family 4 protein n=1 Tax=Haloferax sp. Atlit-6N TaxID=2077205 RepID=UPI0018F29B89|nr:glycosyltransferase family 4 protein [Haloferax sp. Atlit-6N]